jgi:hypothetical protein
LLNSNQFCRFLTDVSAYRVAEARLGKDDDSGKAVENYFLLLYSFHINYFLLIFAHLNAVFIVHNKVGSKYNDNIFPKSSADILCQRFEHLIDTSHAFLALCKLISNIGSVLARSPSVAVSSVAVSSVAVSGVAVSGVSTNRPASSELRLNKLAYSSITIYSLAQILLRVRPFN